MALSGLGTGVRSPRTNTSRIGSAAVAGLLLMTAVAGSLPASLFHASSPLPGGVYASDGYGANLLGLSASNPGAALVAAVAVSRGWRARFARASQVVPDLLHGRPVRATSPPRPLPHQKQPLPGFARADVPAH